MGNSNSDSTHETYAYRLDGVLLEATNDTDSLEFERDPLGRITKELTAAGTGTDWVSSEYDAVGLRKTVRSSKGLFQKIARNAMGDVVAVDASSPTGAAVDAGSGSGSASGNFSASFTRDRLGLELERNLPGGIRARWERDAIGRPVRHEIWRGTQFQSAKQYVWDVNDRLTKVIDAMTGPVDYTHDALGNLASATYADGRVDLRMPDAVGNLFRSSDRTDRKYGPAGQLLESRDERGVTTYDYDAEGNLIKKVEPDGATWKYEWNGAGMLVRVVRPNGHVVEFRYDALARRTAKKYRGKTTRWIWDGNVPLHEWVEREADAIDEDFTGAPRQDDAVAAAEKRLKALITGRPSNGPPSLAPPPSLRSQRLIDAAEEGTAEAPVTWLFEPESFAPLAKLIGDERYSIVTDHLGTPTAMYDSVANEVWAADIDTYGELRNVRGKRQACPFRWPGQYEDEETGLYYNRYRYYFPLSGCFVSADPISIHGGANVYAYPLEPLGWLDPFGLSAQECSGRLKQALRRQLRKIEEKASIPGNSGIDAALERREANKLGEAFVGDNARVLRGRNGEKWLESADGLRLYREPTSKVSDFARTGKQANFHERPNTRTSWFDSQQTSNVHLHVR